MGFFANYKAKRAAKRAKAIYELELYEWERENKVLEEALDTLEEEHLKAELVSILNYK